MVGDASTRSNSVGKVVHRLTQRRQPWQMPKIRSSSFSASAASQNAGFFQSSGWRVGASSEPSRMATSLAEAAHHDQLRAFAPVQREAEPGREVEHLLVAVEDAADQRLVAGAPGEV